MSVANPPRTQMVDANGMVTTEWYRFFVSIQTVVGGASNPIDDATLFALGSTMAPGQMTPVDDLSPPAVGNDPADPLTPPAIVISADDLLYPPRYGA